MNSVRLLRLFLISISSPPRSIHRVLFWQGTKQPFPSQLRVHLFLSPLHRRLFSLFPVGVQCRSELEWWGAMKWRQDLAVAVSPWNDCFLSS